MGIIIFLFGELNFWGMKTIIREKPNIYNIINQGEKDKSSLMRRRGRMKHFRTFVMNKLDLDESSQDESRNVSNIHVFYLCIHPSHQCLHEIIIFLFFVWLSV
jgi:hypothetical protein